MVDWGSFWEFVTPLSVAVSAGLGAAVGAFYGYELAPTVRPRFPWSLFSIGLAFIVLIAMFSVLQVSETGPRLLPFAAARAFLWMVLCASIPAARWLRGVITVRREP
jgi:hypothetical protein